MIGEERNSTNGLHKTTDAFHECNKALFLLQHFDIKVNHNEFMPLNVVMVCMMINIQYFKTYKPENAFESFTLCNTLGRPHS